MDKILEWLGKRIPTTVKGDLTEPGIPGDYALSQNFPNPFNPKTTISYSIPQYGQAIRIMHSVNEGEYGGETIVMWDKEKKKVVYFYFTTAGFYTQGTFDFDGKKYIAHEYVTGNKDGITEVKSSGEILPDGRLSSKVRYLKAGNWVDGHEFYYVEDPTARVVFK